MFKSVIKEIIIMFLLCIAIALILGVLFYDYIPINKVIPTKEAYTTPQNVKEEIEEQITEIQKTEVSYEITGSDLNIYKQSSSYKPGKANPFALAPSNVTNNIENTIIDKPSVPGDGNTNENTNQNSTGTFFNDIK